jgi:UDP-N-acetylglucosamine--N-acetylmuramyl-(pentapeptide) pyrophosphoryl-undecaprenol N-acetylglucosamine transferase
LPVAVIHQAGKGHDVQVRELYSSLGATQVDVVPFISDMQSALRDADLVVGRSGAGATSEICAVGRPALYIPYPFAAGDHQYENARSLAQANAAVVLRAQDASVERVRSEVLRLASDVALLAQLAERARELGRPEAADIVARDLLRLAGIHD